MPSMQAMFHAGAPRPAGSNVRPLCGWYFTKVKGQMVRIEQTATVWTLTQGVRRFL